MLKPLAICLLASLGVAAGPTVVLADSLSHPYGPPFLPQAVAESAGAIVSPAVQSPAPDSSRGDFRSVGDSAPLLTLINAALLALMLLPIATFRDVRERVLNFDIPFLRHDADGDARREHRGEFARRARELHHLFDRHDMAFREFDGLRRVFWAVLGLAALPSLGLSIPLSWRLEHVNFGVIVALVVEAVILVAIGRMYAIPVPQFQSLAHLALERDVDFHPLVDGLGLRLAWDPTVDMDLARPTENDPLRIILITDLKVFGYRFLLIAHNEQGDVFLVSYGPISGRERFYRHMIRPDGIRGAEVDVIELAKERFNLIPTAQEITLRLFVFISIFPGDEVAPLFTRQSLEVHGAGSGRFALGGGGGGGFDVTTNRPDRSMRFRGSGAKITELRTMPDADPVVIRVVERFGDRIRKCKSIEDHFDREGRIAPNPPEPTGPRP